LKPGKDKSSARQAQLIVEDNLTNRLLRTIWQMHG